MHRAMTPHNRENFKYLCEEFKKYNYISEQDYGVYDVKRGLRNKNGTGVLAGLTSICNVVGYDENVKNEKVATNGSLIYRGIDVEDIVKVGEKMDLFMFEEVTWLLLFGSLPTRGQLNMFREFIAEFRKLPDGFAEDMILKCPSPNVMNKMASSVLALYTYDNLAEESSLENTLHQAVTLISCMPTLMVYAYQSKRWAYDSKSMYFHQTKPELSIAENILRTIRPNKTFTHEEAKLLDLCLVLHADHGGGNNSTFATRVVTSTGTDTYSAIAAGIGSLKGPKHGGANIKVMDMLEDMKQNIADIYDDSLVEDYLEKVVDKQAYDRTGLIYGVGHAVYTLSDPRAIILRKNLQEKQFEDKETEQLFHLACAVERLAPVVFNRKKGGKDICANVDLFSGLVYRSMGLPIELFTPLFAVSRTSGWCAHRVEERLFSNRIIRPAYKYLGEKREYIAIEDRKL